MQTLTIYKGRRRHFHFSPPAPAPSAQKPRSATAQQRTSPSWAPRADPRVGKTKAAFHGKAPAEPEGKGLQKPAVGGLDVNLYNVPQTPSCLASALDLQFKDHPRSLHFVGCTNSAINASKTVEMTLERNTFCA